MDDDVISRTVELIKGDYRRSTDEAGAEGIELSTSGFGDQRSAN